MTDTENIKLMNQIKKGFKTLYDALIRKFKDQTVDSIPGKLLIEINKNVNDENKSKKISEPNPNYNKIQLHDEFTTHLNQFFKDFINSNFRTVANASLGDFLDEAIRNWEFCKIFALTYKFVLSAHLRFYQQSYRLKILKYSVATCVLNKFRQQVLKKYQNKFKQIILNNFESERNQEKTQKEKLKNLIEMIQMSGLYELASIESDDHKSKTISFKRLELEKNEKAWAPTGTPVKFFEIYIFKDLIDQASKYYAKRSKTLSDTPYEYITQIIQILRIEQQRAQYYFFDNNHQNNKYITTIEVELIDNKIQAIISNQLGFKKFLQDSDERAIVDLYKICKRRKQKTYNLIEISLTDFIQQKGTTIARQFINQQKKDAIKYVEDMVILKKKMNQIVEKYLAKQLRFCKSRDKAFKDVLKIQADSSTGKQKKVQFMASKNLVAYTDKKLKEIYRIKDQNQREQALNNIILICQNLTAIDVFLLEHQKLMAKRFLEAYAIKPSYQVERNLINKLKQLVGSEQVRNHQKMLTDLQTSDNMQKLLEVQLKNSEFRTSLQVLTNSAWPENEDVQIAFPNCLISQKSILETFYTSKNTGKCLKWMLNKGVSILEGKFAATYKITLSNIMMLILLHINETKNKKILFGDLQRKFKLRNIKNEQDKSVFQSQFKVHLMTLVQQKILKRAKGVEEIQITVEEQFQINRQYVAPQKPNQKAKKGADVVASIGIQPSPKLLAKFKPNNDSMREIREIRNLKMTSVIVQVMKNAKTIKFEDLRIEITKNPRMNGVSFTIPQLKQRLQKLITDQYCYRDQNDRNLLHYIS